MARVVAVRAGVAVARAGVVAARAGVVAAKVGVGRVTDVRVQVAAVRVTHRVWKSTRAARQSHIHCRSNLAPRPESTDASFARRTQPPL